MNSQSKIILILVGLLLGFILLFGVFIFYSISQYAYDDFHERLRIRAVTTAKIQLDYHEDSNYLKNFKEEYLIKLTNEKDFIFELKKDFSIEKTARSLGVEDKFIAEILKTKESYYNKGSLFFSGLLYSSKGKDFIVIVSAENYYNTHHQAYLKQLLIGASLIAVLIIILVGYWFSAKFTRPLTIISQRVNQIGTENLHLRIDNVTENKELKSLAMAFNKMLDRLETSFEAQNNFVSNASHELKTPLTSIICEADLALSKDRESTEYKESMLNIMTEAEKLDSKIKALLFLAQTGFSSKKIKLEKVRIDELLIEAKSTIADIFPDNRLKIKYESFPENPDHMIVKANEQLLLLAFTNIIGNGIKYSDNQEVVVELSMFSNEIEISVTDTGIGIPTEDLPYIFDPFYRASNTSEYQGYGIGLPLARNIVRIHNGDLQVLHNDPAGVVVKIRIPLDKN
ncbi:MAG: ATP-binding protein [Spirosomataceae bacterium]|nr:HAMP domain-containing histidine kinase [Bacteroidota bacterium]